jgi:hypothetical protein
MDDLDLVRKLWLQDEPRFQAFGQYIELTLRTIIRRLGLPATVGARTKEIDSLLRKLIRKSSHTYLTLGDKVGARIVVKRLSDVGLVRAAVEREFTCGQFENTANRLADDQVGYLSTHVDISLKSDDPRGGDFPAEKFRAETTLVRGIVSHLGPQVLCERPNL